MTPNLGFLPTMDPYGEMQRMKVVALLILFSAIGVPAKAQSAVSTQSGSLFPPKAGALPTQIIDLAPGKGATAERGMAARVLIKSWSYDPQTADHKAGPAEPVRGGVFPDEGTFALEPPRPDSLTEEFVNTMLGMRLGGERRLVSDKFGVVIEFTLLAVAATKAELEASLPKKKAEGPTPLKLPKLGAEWKTVDGVPYKVVTEGHGDAEILAGESMTVNAEVLEWTLDVSSPDLRNSGTRPARWQVAFGPEVFPDESAHLSAQLAWCMVGMKVGETRAVILQRENKVVEMRLNDLKFTVGIQTVADLLRGEGEPAVDRGSRVSFQYSTFSYEESAWGMFKSAEEKPWEKLALYSVSEGVLGTDQRALPGLLVHSIPGMKVGGIRSVLIHDDPSPGKSQVYLVKLINVERTKNPSELLAVPSLDAELSQAWQRKKDAVVEAERKAQEKQAWEAGEAKLLAAAKIKRREEGVGLIKASPENKHLSIYAITLGEPLPDFASDSMSQALQDRSPMVILNKTKGNLLEFIVKELENTFGDYQAKVGAKEIRLEVNEKIYNPNATQHSGRRYLWAQILEDKVEGVFLTDADSSNQNELTSLLIGKWGEPKVRQMGEEKSHWEWTFDDLYVVCDQVRTYHPPSTSYSLGTAYSAGAYYTWVTQAKICSPKFAKKLAEKAKIETDAVRKEAEKPGL